jgi:hypothetical protein
MSAGSETSGHGGQPEAIAPKDPDIRIRFAPDGRVYVYDISNQVLEPLLALDPESKDLQQRLHLARCFTDSPTLDCQTESNTLHSGTRPSQELTS